MASGVKKSTFALFFGNRGFFPGSLIASARDEMVQTLKNLGHETLIMDAGLTRHGAVETVAEGQAYAKFLKEHEGQFDGIILSLPNFGDENGVIAALRDVNVPIFVQAYPDDLDKMAPEVRRDSFCGKMSIMDVFFQNDIKYTALKPHTVAPGSLAFAANIDHFDRVCRVVKGVRGMTVGAIGARCTPFKTVRIDEVALQRAGITVETVDLSDVFARMQSVDPNSNAYKDKQEFLKSYTNLGDAPAKALDNILRMGVVLDQLIEEYNLDALAIRCWLELQRQLEMSICVVVSALNNQFLASSCEVDVGNAVAMHALSRASGNVSACLDWNNNYGDDEDKCILFHCGPVPQDMMTEKGLVTGHAILDNAPGIACSYGCNTGRIKPGDFTFSSMMTDAGKLKWYVGEGAFTTDPIPAEFFGCAGVAEIPNLQDVLLFAGRNGHRHHVSVTPGKVTAALSEALGYYLGHQVDAPQEK
ncbi:MAG TPA: hypothetical protein PLU88_04525 [Armatimonadota bacterium]|nr:hypothetical protein [Armatimonadota bacterium]